MFHSCRLLPSSNYCHFTTVILLLSFYYCHFIHYFERSTANIDLMITNVTLMNPAHNGINLQLNWSTRYALDLIKFFSFNS